MDIKIRVLDIVGLAGETWQSTKGIVTLTPIVPIIKTGFSMRRLRSNWRVVVLYLGLLVIGVPWYWPDDDKSVWLGMPAWASVALLVSIAVSVITVIVLLRYRWPGESEESDP